MSGGSGGFADLCKMSISYPSVFLLHVEEPKGTRKSQSEMDAATTSPSHSWKGLQLEILQIINCTPFSLHSGIPGAFGDAVVFFFFFFSAVFSQENTNVGHQNNQDFFFPGQ